MSSLLSAKKRIEEQTALVLIEDSLEDCTLSELRVLLRDVRDMISDREAGLDSGDSL